MAVIFFSEHPTPSQHTAECKVSSPDLLDFLIDKTKHYI